MLTLLTTVLSVVLSVGGYNKASLNKNNSGSGVASGRYCGQSGGRIFILLFYLFFSFGKNISSKMKKIVSSQHSFTHPGASQETFLFFEFPNKKLLLVHLLGGWITYMAH